MRKLVRPTVVVIGILGTLSACDSPPNQQAIALATPAIDKMNQGEHQQEAGENDRKYVLNQIFDPQSSLDPNGPWASADFFSKALPLLTEAEAGLQAALASPKLANLQQKYYSLLAAQCEIDIQFIKVAQKEVAILDAFIQKENGIRNQADVEQLKVDISALEAALMLLQSDLDESHDKIEQLFKSNPGAFQQPEI